MSLMSETSRASAITTALAHPSSIGAIVVHGIFHGKVPGVPHRTGREVVEINAIIDRRPLVKRRLKLRALDWRIRPFRCCGGKRSLVQRWVSLSHHWLYIGAICGSHPISRWRRTHRIHSPIVVHRHDLAKILYTFSGRVVVWMGCTVHARASWAALTVVGIC